MVYLSEIRNGFNKEAAVPIGTLLYWAGSDRLLGWLLLLLDLGEATAHAFLVGLHGTVLLVVLLHQEGVLRLGRHLHLLVGATMVLDGLICLALVRLKDGLHEDLADRYALLKDVEVLFYAMAVIVKKGEEEGL